MRYPELIMAAIREKYTPHVPSPDNRTVAKTVKGRDVEVPLLVPDPRVIYVGPLLDGLVQFMPEVFGSDVVESATGTTGRRKLKIFLMDSAPGDRALNFFGGSLLWMQREGWHDKDGKQQTLTLSDKAFQMEPGEVRNSPVVATDPATGDQAIMERKHGELVPCEPIIFEDKRYGLHYLLRDDFLQYEIINRRGAHIVRRFKLRPVGEGSSEIKQVDRTDVITW